MKTVGIGGGLAVGRDVFISYASKDKAAADAVCRGLEDAGITCWIAPRDVPAGAKYAATLIEAIEQCRAMVLIYTAAVNTSEFVPREVEAAVRYKKIIVTFRLETVLPSKELEFYLSNSHWLEATTPPPEKHIDKLISDIKQLLNVNFESVEQTGKIEIDNINKIEYIDKAYNITGTLKKILLINRITKRSGCEIKLAVTFLSMCLIFFVYSSLNNNYIKITSEFSEKNKSVVQNKTIKPYKDKEEFSRKIKFNMNAAKEAQNKATKIAEFTKKASEYEKSMKEYEKVIKSHTYTFIGQVNKNGKWNGTGTVSYTDGNIYIGNWRDSYKEGYGVEIFKNGGRYEGEFFRGNYNGYGILRNCTEKYCLTFIGHWFGGKLDGYGAELNADGSIKEQGYYEAGVLKTALSP